MICYIDFENTNSGGMNGIDKLSEKDKAVVFYSEASCRATFSLVQNILRSKAVIEFIEVRITAPNALDFQLSSRLGSDAALYPDERFVIISADKGYKAVQVYWEQLNVKVEQYISISRALMGEAVKEHKESDVPAEKEADKDSKLILTISDLLPLCPNVSKKVAEIINTFVTKEEIYKKLINYYDPEVGLYIYQSIKPLLTDKKSMKNASPYVKAATVKKRIPQYLKEASKVTEIINSYDTRMDVRIALESEYGGEKAGKIFSAVFPLITSKRSGIEADKTYFDELIPEEEKSSAAADEQTALISEETENTPVPDETPEETVPEAEENISAADNETEEAETVSETENTAENSIEENEDEDKTEDENPPAVKKRSYRRRNRKQSSLEGYIPQYADDIKTVEKIIKTRRTKPGIKKNLISKYGEEKAEIIFSAITPLIEDKKEKMGRGT